MNMLLLHLMMKFVEQNKSKALTLTKQEQNIRLEKGYRLILGVSDNFDATLSTQNRLKQTHSLVTIITQNGRANEIRKRLVIP